MILKWGAIPPQCRYGDSPSLKAFVQKYMKTERRKKESFGFRPRVEVGYLARLPEQKRQAVLIEELATATGEARRFSFRKKYDWQQMVVDETSGEPLRDVLARGDRPAEISAWEVIETGLQNEDNLIVNISPANADLRYPQSVVDFWQRKGETVTWSRATVNEGFSTLSEIYQNVSGETVTDPLEMLAKPIIMEKGETDEVLNLMTVVGEKVAITQEQIKQVAKLIVEDFKEKFGKEFILDVDKVFRAYSAVMAEVKEMVSNGVSKVWERVKIEAQRLYDYAYLPMINTIMKTYGCDGRTMVGGFVNRITGFVKGIFAEAKSFIGEKSFNCPGCGGEIPSGRGIEKCPHCGMTKQQAGSVCD